MVARGLLSNPGLFDGRLEGDKEVLTRWTELGIGLGIPFSSFHKHLMFMLENISPKTEKRVFNGLQSTAQSLSQWQLCQLPFALISRVTQTGGT